MLLWAKAYEQTGEATYLKLARANASAALAGVPCANGDLCCGAGGRAYAFLAMDRIERSAEWYDRAVSFAEHAALVTLRTGGPWPYGLYKGRPGLVCLYRDLTCEPHERAGFPLVEG